MVVVAGVATVHRFKNVRKTFLRELLPRNLLLTLAAIARTVLNFPQSFRRAYRLVDAEQTFPSCSSNRSSPTVTVDYSSFSFLEILRKVESGPFIIFRPSLVFGRKSLENSELFEKFSPQRAEHPISKYEYISGFSFLIYIFHDIRIFSSPSIHGRSTTLQSTLQRLRPSPPPLRCDRGARSLFVVYIDPRARPCHLLLISRRQAVDSIGEIHPQNNHLLHQTRISR